MTLSPKGKRIGRPPRKPNGAELMFALQKVLAERSLWKFVQLMWHAVEPIAPLVKGWPMEAVCLHLQSVTEGKIRRLLINIPPGSSKSLITNVFYPAWEWGPRRLPSMRYLTAAYSQGLTERDNERMRQLVNSPLYKAMWGDVFIPGDSKEKFANNQTGFKIASSVGGRITGERADRVICDDPNSVQESESETIRESTARWLRETMPTRLNNPAKSAIIVIQQRTHMEDATGVLLDPERGGDEWEHLCIPMQYDPGRHCTTSIGWEDPRGLDDDGEPLPDPWVNEGKLMWPERFPAAEMDQLKIKMGEYAWAGQMQQIPTPRGGSIIRSESWQQYGPDDPVKEKLKFPPFSLMIGFVDTAYTTKEQNDPSAMTIMGVWTNPTTGYQQVMLVYAWQTRLPLHELVQKVAATATKYGIDALLIENKAAGISVQQEIKRLFSRSEWAVRLIDPTPQGSKEARAHAVTHLFDEGMVWAPTAQSQYRLEWVDAVMTQCAQFPRGAHDDLVDCVTSSLRYLRDNGLLHRKQETKWQEADLHASWHEEAGARPLYAA